MTSQEAQFTAGDTTPVYGTTKLRPNVSVKQVSKKQSTKQPTKQSAAVKRVSRGIASLLYDDRAVGTDPVLDAPLESAEVILSSGGTIITRHRASTDDRLRKNQNLAVAIRQQIETRIGKRIMNLSVEVEGRSIVLKGNCATYYSKQLAQHAALDVIEDEHLANEIVVAAPE